MATSLFTERDEPIASVLTRTLLETKQPVPEFLQQYVPEGAAAENPKFETESDYDPDEMGGAAVGAAEGGAWGGDSGANGFEPTPAGEGNEGSGEGWGTSSQAVPNTNTGGGDAWGSANQAGQNTNTGTGDSWGTTNATVPGW